MPNKCCEFEPKIQVDCALELFAIVRSGDLLERRGDALEHAGCALGSLGAYINQSSAPEPFGAPAEYSLPTDLDSCCNELESHLTADVEGYGANPLVIALLTQLAKLVLARLLEKYQN